MIYSDWYKLSFVQCDDGIVRVQGIDQKDNVHLFDISIVDGNVHLTENGVPIGEVGFATKKTMLIYSSPIYSFVMSPSAVPGVEIEDGVIYTVTQGKKECLGTVTEMTLSPLNFDVFIKELGGFDHASPAEELRLNNRKTYEVHPDSTVDGIEMIYIMEQETGEMLIVYGHYEDGERKNEIRFIYSVTP